MYVMQVNKKGCLMMDFWELNMYADAFTAEMVINTDKLWEWRQQGMNVSILNLRKSYMQQKRLCWSEFLFFPQWRPSFEIFVFASQN